MSFVGFIYHNDQVRTASANISENLDELFDVATSVPEVSARLGDVQQQKEAIFTQNIMDAFKGLTGIVVIDEARLKLGLDPVNLVASRTGETALSSKFMNSCLAFDTGYLTAGESKDIYAAFTERQGNDLKLTMVSLQAMDLGKPSDLDVSNEDIFEAQIAAPGYMYSLSSQIYSEAQTASFEQQAAHALQNKAYAYAEQCHLRVVTCDGKTGKPVDRLNTVVTRGHFPARHERSAYAKSLQLNTNN